MIGTIICAAALVLILIGIWHEEKLIAFEDRIIDRLAYITAKAYLTLKKVRIGRIAKSTNRLAKRLGK